MIVILGGFGKTAQAAVKQLRGSGEPVRLVSRSARQAPPPGVELVQADLRDEVALERALRGARAVYALLPDDLAREDFRADRRQLVSTVARAIRSQGIPRIVLLSAVSAALGEDPSSGFGAELAHFERQLLDTPAAVSVLRASYFQDNVLQALPTSEHHGTFLNCWSSRDLPITTVAAADVGALAARTLLETPPGGRELIDLVGPAYTANEMAAALGVAIGRKLRVQDVPREQQLTLFGQWMSAEAAAAMVQTLAVLESERVRLNGHRREFGSTRLEQVLSGGASHSAPTSTAAVSEVAL